MTTRLLFLSLSLSVPFVSAACTEPMQTSAAPSEATPATCTELATDGQPVPDGTYTLYVGGDPLVPWDAYCHAGEEYLTLPAQSATANAGVYQAGGDALGQTVRTAYQRVRIDPITLTVDVSDQTFATSTGRITRGGDVVTAMPFGVAMACGGEAVVGEATIDLRGTDFAVASPFMANGTSPDGDVWKTNGDQTIRFDASGSCGWIGPALVASSPASPLVNAWSLQLAYVQ